MKKKKVIRNGMVAVLYSPGFGAGWYSWNRQYEDLLFHPDLVAMVEEDRKHEIDKWVEEKFPDVYAGGSDQLKIEWLPKETLFQIDEYDGSESIQTLDGTDWIKA